MNPDDALTDMTIEPTVNSDLLTEQTSLILTPTTTNEPSSSIVSKLDTSPDNAQVCCSTQVSWPCESDFPFVNNYWILCIFIVIFFSVFLS